MRTNRAKIAVVAGFLGLAALLGSAAAPVAGSLAGGHPTDVTHAAPQEMPHP